MVSGTGGNPLTFNAANAATPTDTDITRLLNVGVFRRNQFTYLWENDLAESRTLSEDGTRLTVRLKEGLLWSDGEDLTAEDVVFTVNEIHSVREAGSRYRETLYVDGMPTVWVFVDERTFRIELPAVYPDPFRVAAVPILPKHVVEPILAAEGPQGAAALWSADETSAASVVGNGPFVVAEYVPDQYVLMRRNPHYHLRDRAGTQLPYVDEIEYRLFADEDARLNTFLAGEIDVINVRPQDYAVLTGRQEDLGFVLYEVGPANVSHFIAINQNPKEAEHDGGLSPPQIQWLSNLEFRRALAHFVDRRGVIDAYMDGLGYPAYSFVPFTSPFYLDANADLAPLYDPAAARDLLDGLGYVDRDGNGFREDADGNELQLTIRTNTGNTVRNGIIDMFSEEARAAGVNVTRETEDFNALVARLVATYDWELICAGLTTAIDPGLYDTLVPSYGELHFLEPGQDEPRREWEAYLDTAWERNQRTADPKERTRYVQEAQRIWMEQVPVIYVCSAVVIEAYRSRWGNIYPQSEEGYGWHGIIDRVYQK